MWLALLHNLTFFAKIGDFCNPNTANPDNKFFGFPHWWEYIKSGEMDGFGHCTPKVKMPDGLWAIGFAVIDMLLYLAGIVAVISIIIASITYITSMGNTEKATSARKRIVNSLIGLAIVLTASLLVSFIGNKLS